jgi:thiol-disulfide isomerase/thioredoxin
MQSLSSLRGRIAVLAFVSLGILGVLAALDTKEPAPKFAAKTLDGEKFTNETLKGKVVLLQFWTTWCPYCRKDQPEVDALGEELADKGLVVLAVNAGESKGTVKHYLEQSPRSSKIVLAQDTNLLAAFEVKTYPHYVLIGQEGDIVGAQSGAGGRSALLRLLRKAKLVVE